MNSNKKKTNKADWIAPIGLIMLSLVPVIAGAARVAELTSGAEITAANARFFASPVPVLVHIISVTLYSLLGPCNSRAIFAVRNQAGIASSGNGSWSRAESPLRFPVCGWLSSIPGPRGTVNCCMCSG